MTLVNAECRLAARPVGLPKPSDWDVIETPVADLADGEFLVGVEYVSIDPAMRTWMNAGRSYVPPVEIGEVMRAGGIGQIIDSRHPDFAVGEQVSHTVRVWCSAAPCRSTTPPTQCADRPTTCSCSSRGRR